MDLCQRVNFGVHPYVKDGVRWIGFLSRRRTLARNTEAAGCNPNQPVGDCHRMYANLAMNPAKGSLALTVKSDLHQRCVGGFGVGPDGMILGSMRVPIRGTVMIFSSHNENEPAAIASSDPSFNRCLDAGNTGIDPACYTGGLTCLYCFQHEDQASCSFVVPGAGDDYACDPDSGPALFPHLPGAEIIPDAGAWDVFGDADAFFAGDGAKGLTRYYLKGFAGKVKPYWPVNWIQDYTGQSYSGNWCRDLCHIVKHDSDLAWSIQCFGPIVHPNGPEAADLEPRAFSLFGGSDKMTHAHFEFANELGSICFVRSDQQCFTAGPLDMPVPHPWNHDSPGNVGTYDSLAIDLRYIRIADDPVRYPHATPATVAFMNDCLKELSDPVHGIGALTDPGHLLGKFVNFDNPYINEWVHIKEWRNPDTGGLCHYPQDETWHPLTNPNIPTVRRRGQPDTGFEGCDDLWCVWVKPYNEACRHPYWVMLKRCEIHLWMSAQAVATQDRWLAIIDIELNLQLWYAHNGAPYFTNKTGLILCAQNPNPSTAFADRCNPSPLDPDSTHIVYTTPDGADYVPLTVRWRGLLGPRPWSSCDSPLLTMAGCAGLRNSLSTGIVIPGEVNDTEIPAETCLQPSMDQRYAGYVGIML